MNQPVLIIGAGPVGMITALFLDRLGVPSLLIEKRKQLPDIPRAIHLDSEIINILKLVGLDDFITNQIYPSKGLFLFGKNTNKKFLQANLNFNNECSSFLFDQNHLEQELLREIEKSINISLKYNCEFISAYNQKAELAVQGQVIDQSFSYLIGTDGANSKVADVSGIKYTEYPYRKINYKVDFITDQPPNYQNRIEKFCSTNGSFVRMAFKDRVRVEITNNPNGEAEYSIKLIEKLAQTRVKKVLHADKYYFNTRIANKWIVDRTIIAGDAAHTMPPYIGEGLCNGIRDAFNLSWKVAFCYYNGHHDFLIKSYSKERKNNVKKYIGLTLLTGFLFTTSLRYILKPFELLGIPLKINQKPVKKGKSDLIIPKFDLLANVATVGREWDYMRHLYNSFTIITSEDLSKGAIKEITRLFTPFNVNFYSPEDKIAQSVLRILKIKKVKSVIIRPDLSVLFSGILNEASRIKIQNTFKKEIIS
ncbi:FAD-dependent monooxygenase [Mangrovivirga sp. M17]|uniref:FAD-dependent monooxygenase n=1 Tax=Mangrovivirga halotolerans TaxID=2993936 RepID=A0ABT3RRN8_9BACT|nr:FAD-dependent monooxygenase [Mangrovivirga halotolerans]